MANDKRVITCTNDDNYSITFGSTFSPLLLTDADGLYMLDNNVNTSENTMVDGSTYQGSTTKQRNIVLTAVSKTDHQDVRQLLYKCFKPKSQGTLLYVEGTESRQIKYYVESVNIDAVKRARSAVISLICNDPFFQDLSDTTVVMAGWESLFTFAHEFISGGEEFGTRQSERIKVIQNDSAADNIGLTITIAASGAVTNPKITHVELDEEIQIGTTANPLNMVSGDQVIITTGTNNKHVYLVHGGVKTEINEYLSESSEFIQLMRGSNSLGYEASAGADYMTVSVSWRYLYLGC